MSDATWHPKRVTHGKSHMVHLNVWLTISHMIDDAIKGNKRIKKKKMVRGRERIRERYFYFFFSSLLS